MGLQITCARAKPHSESTWSFFKVLSVSKFNFFTFNLFGFWGSLLQRAYVWLLSPVSGSVTRTGLVVHGLELITDFAGAPQHIGT